MIQQGPWSNGVTMTLEGYLPLYLHVLAAALLAAAFLGVMDSAKCIKGAKDLLTHIFGGYFQ